MSTEIFGSHEKTFPGKGDGRGQNGGDNPASVRGRVPNIPAVSPPGAIVPGLDSQDTLAHRTRGAPVPHSHSEPRGPSSGSPGGVVPGNDRPVTKPATPGAFSRD